MLFVQNVAENPLILQWKTGIIMNESEIDFTILNKRL